MKKEDLMRAMNEIDDRFIEEAENSAKPAADSAEEVKASAGNNGKSGNSRRFFGGKVSRMALRGGVLAACLVGVFSVGVLTERMANTGNTGVQEVNDVGNANMLSKSADFSADYELEQSSMASAESVNADMAADSGFESNDDALSVAPDQNDGTISTEKLVYTCNLTIQTKDYAASKAVILEQLKRFGGIIEIVLCKSTIASHKKK